jgi:ABC-type multidrug transport system permease subunit
MKARARVIGALTGRALNEILRVPGAAIPGILAPTIFMLGISSVFGQAVHLPHFGASDFRSFIVPVGLLQSASFAGAATGVNLARDIEHGWFDRLLLCPTPRVVLLGGIVGSASLRALLPSSFLVAVALALGVPAPSLLGIGLAAVLVMGLAMAVAFYAVMIALHFRTQQAAPLMQIGGFIAVLFTSAYAPVALLTGWLQTITRINPVTQVLTGVRQGFVSHVTWGATWPALVSLAGMLLVLGALAVRALLRTGA